MPARDYRLNRHQSFQSDHSMSTIFSSCADTSLAQDVAHGLPIDDPEAHQVVCGERNDEGQRELLHHLASASADGIPEGESGHHDHKGETRPQVREKFPSPMTCNLASRYRARSSSSAFQATGSMRRTNAAVNMIKAGNQKASEMEYGNPEARRTNKTMITRT